MNGNETSKATEIHRLRALIIETADGLDLVVAPALVAACQHATDDNLDLRMALMELRTLIVNLKGSGRPHLTGCDCPIDSPYALCRDKPHPGRYDACKPTTEGV